MKLTTLEANFMQEMLKEAYGGTLFTTDINPAGMSKAQKSGVVSSLSKKNILGIDQEYGQVGIVPEGKDAWDTEWEVSKTLVEDAIARAEVK